MNSELQNVAFLSFDGSENSGGVQRVSFLLSTIFEKQGMQSYLIYDKSVGAPASFYAGKLKYTGDEDNLKLKEFIRDNNIRFVLNNCVVSSVYTGAEIRAILDDCGCKMISIIHAKPDLIKVTPSIYSLYWNMRFSKSFMEKVSSLLKLLLFPLYKPYSNKKYIGWRKGIHENSDMVIVLSNSYINNLCEMLNVDETKVRAIPNPLTFEYECSETDIEEKRKEVLIVSRLEESAKGLSRVFKAWGIIENNNPTLDWQLSVVGSGPDEIYYKELCAKLNLKSVRFYGHQKPFEFYLRSSIFIMASFHEGLPMTVLEAEQMGLAIIALNNFESLDDLLVDDWNGLLVNDDISELADSIQRLMSDPELCRKYSRNSIAHSKLFAVDVVAEKWFRLINELADKQEVVI